MVVKHFQLAHNFSYICLSFSIAIQNRNPVWYQALTRGLNEEQRKQLQDIATLADQRRAAHGMHFSVRLSDITYEVLVSQLSFYKQAYDQIPLNVLHLI